MMQPAVYWVISGWDGNGQFQVTYITHERRVNNYTAARMFASKRLGLQDVSVSKRQQKTTPYEITTQTTSNRYCPME